MGGTKLYYKDVLNKIRGTGDTSTQFTQTKSSWSNLYEATKLKHTMMMIIRDLVHNH